MTYQVYDRLNKRAIAWDLSKTSAEVTCAQYNSLFPMGVSLARFEVRVTP